MRFLGWKWWGCCAEIQAVISFCGRFSPWWTFSSFMIPRHWFLSSFLQLLKAQQLRFFMGGSSWCPFLSRSSPLTFMGDPTSSYATAGIALRIICPSKPDRNVEVVMPAGRGGATISTSHNSISQNIRERSFTRANAENEQRRPKVVLVAVQHRQVWRILRHDDFYSYHLQRVQQLLLKDHANRVQFCEFCLTFCSRISIIFARGNLHSWTHENTHEVAEYHFQYRFFINTWCGVLGDNPTGPHIIETCLGAPHYRNFLKNELPLHLGDAHLAMWWQMWLKHDRTPPYFAER
jgi:hypothetical protein